MFVRNLWYVAAWASELTEGLLARTIIGDPVLLYRESSGKAVAIGNLCPHRFAPLDKGRRCEDDTIECTYHGLRFDSTGLVTTIYGDVNGDGVADFHILVAGLTTLLASDFIL